MPWLEVLGWLGMAVTVLSLVQTRILWLRIMNSIGSFALLIYNLILGIWPMVALNALLIAINLFQLWRLLRTRHDDRTYVAAPIGLDEPVLANALGRHEAQIRQFYPGLGARLTDKAERAYLVTTGDELAAILLSKQGDEPGTEQLLVDYAVPKFRDFTPGQFVYSARGPFAALGRSVVLAPAGETQAERYRSEVGFVNGRKDLRA